ncbi:MAG: hypothetical protein FWC68_01085, partial [Oscillospiraceae bacterium]|nr:hypothetical protein [Oscillospiraceae bacterium]
MITNVETKHIQALEVEDSIFGNGIVGSFVRNNTKLKLINITKQYNELKNTEIHITGFGTRYVDDIVPTQEDVSIELKCVDLSYRFDREYALEIEFPISLYNWARQICEKVGVELGSTEFPNSTFILNTQPFIRSGASYRDVMRMIAESAGSFVKFDRDDKLYIRWFDDEVTNIEDWFSLKQGKETNAVNVVVLGRGDVEDNIYYPTGLPEEPFELRVDENEILYFNREEMIVPIYEQVEGFKYFLLKMTTAGRLSLEPGSRIRYKDIDGLEVETYIMSHKLVLNGGDMEDTRSYTSTIETYEIRETSTRFQYAGTIEKRLSNAEIIVDRQNQRIQQIVNDVGEFDERIAEVEQTAEGISQTVSEFLEFERIVSGVNEIYLREPFQFGLIRLSVQGDSNISNFLFPSSDVYPSTELFPRPNYVVLCIDTNSRRNPSENLREIRIQLKDGLYNVGNVFDELVVQNGSVSVVRRIGRDTDGILFVLPNPVIEEYGEIDVELFNEGTYLYLKWFENLRYTATYTIRTHLTENFATHAELVSRLIQTSNSIMLEVNKKVGEDEFGAMMLLNYLGLQIAWNHINEFIQFVDGQLQIKDEHRNLLMALDRNGQRFYDSSGNEIGQIGVRHEEFNEFTGQREDSNHIAFAINNDRPGNKMTWGIRNVGDDRFFPIFQYGDYNVFDSDAGASIGGLFRVMAPMMMGFSDIVFGDRNAGGYSKISGDPVTGGIHIDTDGAGAWIDVIRNSNIRNVSNEFFLRGANNQIWLHARPG